MLHSFVFTIQLALLRDFNVKVKNLVFDTSKSITNAWFSMKDYDEELGKNVSSQTFYFCGNGSSTRVSV